jgi:hypothetical protein
VIDLTTVIEQFLEPATPGVLLELDRAVVAAAALAIEVRAGRAVAAARFVGREDLDETDVADRLADAVDAYDHATGVPRTATGGADW